MMTRTEHLQWCKDRAMEYLNQGDYLNALTSMLSDLDKHPETSLHTATGGFLMLAGNIEVTNRSYSGMKRWIEGFN